MPAGQLVPSARQTFLPLIVAPVGSWAKPVTYKLATVSAVPVAVLYLSQPVEVTLVKIAAAAEVWPMVVPLMVPPVIVTEGETRPAALILRTLSVVPEAVTKPKKPVEVALVNTPVEGVVAPMAALLMLPPVMVTEGETKLVKLALAALSVVPEAVA